MFNREWVDLGILDFNKGQCCKNVRKLKFFLESASIWLNVKNLITILDNQDKKKKMLLGFETFICE